MGNRKNKNEPKRIHSIKIKDFVDKKKTQSYYHKVWVSDVFYYIGIEEMEQINPTEFLIHFAGGKEVLNEQDEIYYIKKKKEENKNESKRHHRHSSCRPLGFSSWIFLLSGYKRSAMKKHDNSGYWEAHKGRWWAVVRHTTMNLLVGVYPTEEEAKEAYEEAQKEWDDAREAERDHYRRVHEEQVKKNLEAQRKWKERFRK